jgi:predicted Na+-dependent transporter
MKNTIPNTDTDVFAIVIIVVFSICLGIIIGRCIERSKMQQKAIEMGVGRYNPTNAIFEWVVDKK